MKVRDIIKLCEAVKYVVVYEKSGTGWAAYIPDLPGVMTTVRTRTEVRFRSESAGYHQVVRSRQIRGCLRKIRYRLGGLHSRPARSDDHSPNANRSSLPI